MSVTVAYSVTCDAPDTDDPDEHCEAEFEHIADGLSDVAGLRRQIDGRGWTYRSGKFTCPRHGRKAKTDAG